MPLLQILIAALLITRVTVSMGVRAGLVDGPSERKQHQGEVPLTGGIAVFLTLLFGTFVLGVAPYTYPMLLIACAVLLIGVFDDCRHISASARLLLEFGSGILLATFGNISIVTVGDLLALGDIPLLFLAIPLSALAVAGLSNAYNMIDGIDGLAASTIVLPLLVLYLLALQAAHPMANALLVMLVPLVVFLLFNLGPNNRLLPKMFLGDAGSVTLGFLVTASLVFFSQGGNALIKPVTALWLVTLPLMDMIATMLRRARRGHSLVKADRSHLHHTLMDNGLGRTQTLVVMVGYAALCAILGLVLEHLPDHLSLLCYVLLFCAHCGYVVSSDRCGGKRSGSPTSG